MLRKMKQMGCYLSIILLLPYIITVFLNGPNKAANANVEKTYVMVESDGNQIEMSLEEYCIGKLAKEIPIDYEEETLKAQAVLVRTAVYKKIKETGSSIVLEDEFWTTKEVQEQWGKNHKSSSPG